MLAFTEFFKLFIPCLVNFLIPAMAMHFALPQDKPSIEAGQVFLLRGAKRIILLFGVTIGLAVAFDMILHLPAAAGMMAGLSLLQFFYYYLQKSTDSRLPNPSESTLSLNVDEINSSILEARKVEVMRLDIFEKVGRLEWDTLLFFYGAMMGIGGLGYIGYLDAISHVLYGQLSPTLAHISIGLSSAFVDNGTLMFAILTMHLDIPQGQWLLLTLTLGVGGSLLAIGSAPAIGLLGQAKGQYTFSGHLKWFPVILLSYFASIGVHFLVNPDLNPKCKHSRSARAASAGQSIIQPGSVVLASNRSVPTSGTFASKITLPLFIFHRTGLVVIDEPALPFRGGCQQHFLNDFRQRASSGFDGAG